MFIFTIIVKFRESIKGKKQEWGTRVKVKKNKKKGIHLLKEGFKVFE